MTDEQQVTFFGTPINALQTIRTRRLRRSVGKAHAEWVGCWYLQMRDLAKLGGTMGTFTTDIESFVDAYGGHVPHADDPTYPEWRAFCVTIWRAFEAAGIVRLAGAVEDVDETFRVTVVDFAETNVTRAKSAAERARDYRARKRHVTRDGDEDPDPGGRNDQRDDRDEFDESPANTLVASRNVTPASRRHVNNQPTNQTKEEDASVSASVVRAPSPNERANAEIRRCQSQLGDLSILVDDLAALRAKERCLPSLLPSVALSELWVPIAALKPEFGRDVLRDALAEAVLAQAPNAKFVAKCCASQLKKQERGLAKGGPKDDPAARFAAHMASLEGAGAA